MLIDFVAGAFGGACGLLIGHPFDTVKVRLQSGAAQCIRSAIGTAGLRSAGLFRGVSSPLASITGVNAVVFGVHGTLMRRELDAIAAGAVTGCAQALVTGPMELIKTRCQVEQQRPLSVITRIWRESGIRGFGRGLPMTCLRDAPAFACYFGIYNLLTPKDSKNSYWKALMSGGVAGTASWAVVYPTDVIKTRVQMTGQKATDVFKELMKKPKLMFAGLNVTLIRAFPVNAVTFLVVESVLDWQDKMLNIA